MPVRLLFVRPEPQTASQVVEMVWHNGSCQHTGGLFMGAMPGLLVWLHAWHYFPCMWQLVPAGWCLLGWHIDGGLGGAWSKDNRRGHGWSRKLGCLEKRHSGVLEAAGWLDQILILLLWQNGIMGQKTRIVGGHVFVCTCLTCVSCCDWFVFTDINVIWVTWVLRERHNAREASSILFLLDLSSAYCQIIVFPAFQWHWNTLAECRPA